MAKILLLGAGRSATVLLNYLLDQVRNLGWHLTIADVSVSNIQHLAQDQTVRMLPSELQNEALLRLEMDQVDLVISMLPAQYHGLVAKHCLTARKNLLTASYVSPEIKALHEDAKKAGLIFMMEAGLDPGIDHMSAMAIIQEIQEAGGEITSFKSYTGGLISPESDDNPWHYKFTWNPRNVVLAGQGTAHFLEAGNHSYIPYQQLFSRAENLTILNWGTFEGYANRDSLVYREQYGLGEVKTLLRGTLRRQGFCKAWHLLVQLGLTDDSYVLENSQTLTYLQFIKAYLPGSAILSNDWLSGIIRYFNLAPDNSSIPLLKYLEFPDEIIGLDKATPAQILEKLLLKKWQLLPHDKDMIVMQHLFEYQIAGERRKITSSLVVLGDDNKATAMAKTVGLPVGIIAKLMLQNRLKQTGVIIPTHPEVYQPVLQELRQFGIIFIETNEPITQKSK